LRAFFIKNTNDAIRLEKFKQHKRIEKQGCNSIIGCNVLLGQLYYFINKLNKVINNIGEKNEQHTI
jgi:hypothetical protein